MNLGGETIILRRILILTLCIIFAGQPLSAAAQGYGPIVTESLRTWWTGNDFLIATPYNKQMYVMGVVDALFAWYGEMFMPVSLGALLAEQSKMELESRDAKVKRYEDLILAHNERSEEMEEVKQEVKIDRFMKETLQSIMSESLPDTIVSEPDESSMKSVYEEYGVDDYSAYAIMSRIAELMSDDGFDTWAFRNDLLQTTVAGRVYTRLETGLDRIPRTANVPQMVAVIDKYLADNPTKRNQPAAILVWRALADADW